MFSADSQWPAYAIGYSEAQEEKLRQQKKPIQRKLGMLELASGEMTTVDGVESFAFNASGSHLAMRRYAPERKDPPDAAAPADDDSGGHDAHRPRAGDRTRHDVRQRHRVRVAGQGRAARARDQRRGQTGNGVQLFDPATGSLRVLDSAPAIYTGLTWRKDADDLAVLRGATDDHREGADACDPGVAEAGPDRAAYDPASTPGFPAGSRIVSFRRPAWSDDGRTIFVGVAQWHAKCRAPAKPKARQRRETGEKQADKDEKEPDEPAAVDVWHPNDVDVMAKQKINARTDRQRNLLAAWHLDTGRFVQLGKICTSAWRRIRRQRLAYARNWAPYAMDRSIGRPAADLYVVDLDTGARTKLKDGIDDRYVQASPAAGTCSSCRTISTGRSTRRRGRPSTSRRRSPTSFVDRESDATVKQKPPFGVAGWTKNDAARAALRQVRPLGGRAGRHRRDAADATARPSRCATATSRLDPDEEWIDLEQPLLRQPVRRLVEEVRLRAARSRRGVTRHSLRLDDKRVDGLGKAKNADVFAYVVQDFDDSPDCLGRRPRL